MTNPLTPAGDATSPTGLSDPLERVAATLGSLDTLPLEQHPQAFTVIDEHLRAALDAPVAASPSAGAG